MAATGAATRRTTPRKSPAQARAAAAGKSPAGIAADSLTADSGTADQAEPMDVLLADAALGTYRRFIPGAAGVRTVLGLARRPFRVTRRGIGTAGEMARNHCPAFINPIAI